MAFTAIGTHDCQTGPMDAVEASNLWAALPGGLQAEVDQLIRDGRPIQAIAEVRNRANSTPKPGLKQAKQLIELRERALGADG